MTSPALTVVTICRNVRAGLARTVESVLAQRYPTLEYWVIDGASTDGTAAYLETLGARGVRWISEPDRGISDAMNKGIARARGEWIAHLHADDVYLPGALERFAGSARPEVDVVTGWMLKAEPQGDVLCRCDPSLLPREMAVNHPATFVRREWLERLNGFDTGLRYAMDYDFFLRAQEAGARFSVLEAPLVRMAGGGLSEHSLWKTLEETRRIRQRHRTSGWHRSRAWLLIQATKGYARLGFQRLGLHGAVAWYRRTLARPRKGLRAGSR